MGDGGPPHRALSAIRAEFPLSVHGVGLSIGSQAELIPTISNALPGLSSAISPAWCPSTWHGRAMMRDISTTCCRFPTIRQTLERVTAHIGQIQDRLKRPILLENPSTYVAFEQSTMSETDFIREIARRSGCGLLLDINNVFVSATNHGWKPMHYLRDFPLELVEEIHLAGHAEDTDDEGELLLIDAHDRPVADEVWKLYEIVISQAGPADPDRMGQRRSRMAGAAQGSAARRRHSGSARPGFAARIPSCCGMNT
jgi:uncharacterized protein (UPF0276 family)